LCATCNLHGAGAGGSPENVRLTNAVRGAQIAVPGGQKDSMVKKSVHSGRPIERGAAWADRDPMCQVAMSQ
jgi:hypothetical protein